MTFEIARNRAAECKFGAPLKPNPLHIRPPLHRLRPWEKPSNARLYANLPANARLYANLLFLLAPSVFPKTPAQTGVAPYPNSFPLPASRFPVFQFFRLSLLFFQFSILLPISRFHPLAFCCFSMCILCRFPVFSFPVSSFAFGVPRPFSLFPYCHSCQPECLFNFPVFKFFIFIASPSQLLCLDIPVLSCLGAAPWILCRLHAFDSNSPPLHCLALSCSWGDGPAECDRFLCKSID